MSKILTFLLGFLVLSGPGNLFAQNHQGPWSLEDCISYALTHNSDVRQSELALEVSKATQAQAKAAILPTGRAGVSHGYNFGRSINPFTNQYVEEQIQTSSLDVSSNLLLFNGLQLQNNIKQTTLGVKASQQDLEQAANTVSLNIALAYLAILQNQELLEIATRQLTTSQEQITRAEKLVNAGVIAQSTLADLQVQAGNDELEKVNAHNNLTTAKLTLMQLMNLPAEADFQVQPLNVNSLAVGTYDKTAAGVYEIAQKTQPAIIGADLRVQSSQKLVQAARGALLPSLSLVGYMGTAYSSAVPTSRFVADGTGFTTQDVASETDYVLVNGNRQPIISTQQVPNGQMENFYYLDQLKFNLGRYVGLNLSIPILNGWQTRNRISNAVITRKRAEFAADNARIQLRQNIEQAYTNLNAAQTRLETSRKQADASAIAYQAAQKRFENGSVHFVDLNLAKTNYDRAQLNMVRARYDYVFRKKILDFYQDKPLTLQE
ncbi:TolC family protein [Adhaeribacter rhizoryzae]|uniref:TolC family protein n=1 Tax=Adhaeribacter rhizoryzae TaxID=2607907 RepID=A0A5M6DRS8_9BACT|nr:TolC family protein [Adhaeribacter rhizoryzae]KAA5549026.1 TolC family protein [Adhaeribacter rhizoryzae]